MEHPTEDQIQAMSNREFATLIRTQAEMIDQSVHRRDRPESDARDSEPEVDGGRAHRRRQGRQKQKV